MTQLKDKHWAVEVPEYVKDFISFVKSLKNEDADIHVGKVQFLFATATATEEDARKVVECKYEVYRDYDTDNFHFDLGFIAALDSLYSLLRSKSLDPKNNYAIIEKQTNGSTT